LLRGDAGVEAVVVVVVVGLGWSEHSGSGGGGGAGVVVVAGELLVGMIVEDGGGAGAGFVAGGEEAAVDGEGLTGLQVGVAEGDVGVELLLKEGVFGLEASLFVLDVPVQGLELAGGTGEEGGLLEVLGLIEESFEEDVAFVEGGAEGFGSAQGGGFFLCLCSALLGFQTVEVLGLQEEGFKTAIMFVDGATEGFGLT